MLAHIWDDFLKIMSDEAGSRVVETWLKAVNLYKWDSQTKTVYLFAPNNFIKDWIKKNYLSFFQIHLGRLLNVEMPKIIFDEPVAYSSVDPKKTEPEILPAVVSKKQIVAKPIHGKSQSHINSNYIFENFIVGPSNSLSYAAAHAVTEKPGLLYNPLFIYGGSGLGKTHLMHAIGNEIMKSRKNATILYQPADRFVSEFISAIRFDKILKFQNKYKNLDVLLIDDIQFISNKEQTQEAFFHIFNSLYDAHKQIIFSSDTYPHCLQGIAERLRSRLACGLVTDIHMPSLETKIAILKKKGEVGGCVVPDEVAHFIASRAITNIRELEGAMIRVIAFTSLTKQSISLELAQKVLVREQIAKRPVDVDCVVKYINSTYGYDLAQLQSKVRNKDLSYIRQLAMFLMKKFTDKSLREIGMYLGGRDHSTVMHALEKITNQLDNDSKLQTIIQKFEREFVA